MMRQYRTLFNFHFSHMSWDKILQSCRKLRSLTFYKEHALCDRYECVFAIDTSVIHILRRFTRQLWLLHWNCYTRCRWPLWLQWRAFTSFSSMLTLWKVRDCWWLQGRLNGRNLFAHLLSFAAISRTSVIRIISRPRLLSIASLSGCQDTRTDPLCIYVILQPYNGNKAHNTLDSFYCHYHREREYFQSNLPS